MTPTLWITISCIAVIPATIIMWRIFRKITPQSYNGYDRQRRDAPHVDDLAFGVIAAMFWPVAIIFGLAVLLFRAATNFGYQKPPQHPYLTQIDRMLNEQKKTLRNLNPEKTPDNEPRP